MKRYLIFVSSWLLAVSGLIYVRSLDPFQFYAKTTEQARQADLNKAEMGFLFRLLAKLTPNVKAGGFRTGSKEGSVGDPLCDKIVKDAWDRVDASEIYRHDGLREFNRTFRMLNEGFPSSVESTFCHFTRSMKLRPDTDHLPVNLRRMFRGKEVELEVATPTEVWARDLGYEYKAWITIDGTVSLVVYWVGSEDRSKGFMIEGVTGLSSQDGEKHASYTQWNRMGSEQSVRYWGAEFESGYLENAGIPRDPGHHPDRAIFGKLLFQKETGAVFLQTVVMEPQQPTQTETGQFGCFRLFAKGTKNDSLLIAKTEDDRSTTGHARNSTAKGAEELNAIWLRDHVLTKSNVGTLTRLQFETLVVPTLEAEPFDKSCNDLYTAGIAGGPFAGPESDVNFEARPDEIFGGVP